MIPEAFKLGQRNLLFYCYTHSKLGPHIVDVDDDLPAITVVDQMYHADKIYHADKM